MNITRQNGLIITLIVGLSMILLYALLKKVNLYPLLVVLSIIWPIFSYRMANKIETNSTKTMSLYFILFFGLFYVILIIALVIFFLAQNGELILHVDSISSMFYSLWESGFLVITILSIIGMVGYVFIFIEEDTYVITIPRTIILLSFLTVIISYIEFLIITMSSIGSV